MVRMVCSPIAAARSYSLSVALLLCLVLAVSPARAQDSLLVLYNNLGVIYATNGELDLAAAYLDSARQLGTANAAVLNNLANSLLCRGRIETALELYALAHQADTSDRSQLFNWSVGLYVADSVAQSVELMKSFLDYAIAHPEAPGFTASLASVFDSLKGDAKTVTKAEIDRLLARARERMKTAADTNLVKPVADSLALRAPHKGEVVVPAGSKSAQLPHLARVLYWIVL